MNESRSFASLEPTLLARKGGAKPAMRPQVGPAAAAAAELPIDEDLGWNDMGDADGELLTRPALNGNGHGRGKPDVRRQLDELAAQLLHDRSTAPRMRRTPAAKSGRRAAFTLRLDQQRHLKLRLACTIKNRSAQQIVTEALDRLLNGIPELDTLAAQLTKR